MDFRLIAILVIFSVVIIIPAAYGQNLNENSLQKSVKVNINSNGQAHVIHIIKSSNSPHQIELIPGTITNLNVKDKNGNGIQFGEISENSIMLLPSNEEITIEYDLSDVMSYNDNFWLWDFLYLESTSFYFPEGVDLVFVDDKPAFLADKKGIICHGCQMKLEYSLNEPKFYQELKINDEKYKIQFRTWDEIKNLSLDKELGGLTFHVQYNDSFVTTGIPKNLIISPFNVFLDDEKIFFHKFNENSTYVWLNMRPEHSGEISITGTIIPDLSNYDQSSIQFPIEFAIVIIAGIGIAIALIFIKRKK